MAEIRHLVICNYEVPIQIIHEVMKIKFKIDLYDIISFPYLNEIILTEGKSLEENYLFYTIKKMIILHEIKKVVFITNITNHDPYLEMRMMDRLLYLDVDAKVFTYEFNKNEVSFHETSLSYRQERSNRLIFLCSDGRLTKIYMDSLLSPDNPLGINADAYCIRLPGSTLPLLASEEKKSLADIIKTELAAKQIREIYVDHHGDCNAFRSYYQISGKPYQKRSLEQHLKKMEAFQSIFRIDGVKIFARYIDFDFDGCCLVEWKIFSNENKCLEAFVEKKIPFDFQNLIFIDKNVLTGVK